jgi:membrane protease YdiL (CAAX protease family)
MKAAFVSVGKLFWNARERRLRMFWRLLAWAILFVLVALLLGIGIGVGLEVAGVATGPVVMAWLQEPLFGLGMLVAVSIASTWLAARFLDRRRCTDLGLQMDRAWWADLGFGLGLGAFLMTAIFAVEWAAGWLAVTGVCVTDEPGQPFILDFFVPVVAFLCVGFYEELITRGYLLRNLAEGLKHPRIGAKGAVALAWLLSSVLFGLLHAGNANATTTSTINLCLAGLFLGLGYVLTGRLAIPIGLHITWNLFQGNVFGLPVSGNALFPTTVVAVSQSGPDLWTGGVFGPEAGLLGILASLVGSLLIVLWARRRYGRRGLDVSLAEPPGLRAKGTAKTEATTSV